METAERLKERKTREVVNGETFTDSSDELNQVEKVEEYTSSVIVRSRKMRNGDRSLFLDIYYGKGNVPMSQLVFTFVRMTAMRNTRKSGKKLRKRPRNA